MEFKELLAYAKRSWLVILLVTLLAGFGAFFFADYFPNRDSTKRFSASGEFDLPLDSFRITGLGSGDTRRIVIDNNTEVASVSSQGNRETAARYFVVLERVAQDLRATLPPAKEGEEQAAVTTLPAYDQALKQLSSRAEYIYGESGSSASEYYSVTVNGTTYGLASVATATPNREAEVRSLGGPNAGTKVVVTPVNNSRRVVVNVDGATSQDAARMWADSVLLAAKRESFQRVLSQFDALISRSTEDLTRELAEVPEARKQALQAAADARLAALREQAAQVKEQAMRAAANPDASEEAVTPEADPELVFVEVPEFNPDQRNAERRAYYGRIRSEIENRHPEIAVAVQMGALVGGFEQAQIAQWRADLGEQQRRVRTAQSSLNVRLVAAELALKAERERFDRFKAENRVLEFIPNLGIVNSPEMTRARTELDTAMRDRSDKEQRLQPEHSDMIEAHRRLKFSIERWEAAIVQAFGLAQENIRVERDTIGAELAAATSSAQVLLGEIAKLQEKFSLAVNHSVAYDRAVKEFEAARDVARGLESNLATIRRTRNNQVPVISVSSFTTRAVPSVTGTGMSNLQISLVVAVMTLVSSAVLIYVWALSRNRIGNEFDVRKHINLPVLAKFSRRDPEQISLLNVNPKSGVSEAFSTLATLVRSYAKELSLRSLLVTSAIMEEGKTDISSNLGIALSRKGLRVLVVDADLHRSRVGNFFGSKNGNTGRGLLQWVADGGKGDVSDYASTIPEGPDLLLPGGQVEDPVRLLESDAFKALMKQAEREYDFVIYDSPPVTRVGDALILAGDVDATILVCSCGDVSFADAAMAKRLLTNVQANMLGVVLNNSKDAEAREYYNYYSYGRESRRRVRKVVD